MVIYDKCYELLKSLHAETDMLRMAAENPHETLNEELVCFYCYAMMNQLDSLLEYLDKWDAGTNGKE